MGLETTLSTRTEGSSSEAVRGYQRPVEIGGVRIHRMGAARARSTGCAAPVQSIAMSTRSIWLTRANGLSLLRILLAPALALAVTDGAAAVAAALFWLAVVTDVADGRVARRRGEVTPYGRLFDHAADATFVSVGAAALASMGALPIALPLLIAAAFLQYAFDSRSQGIREPRRTRLGHWNGVAYYVVVAVPVMRDALGLAWPGAALVQAFGWLLAALTLVSMGDRLRVALSAE
jgi:phosphatidylglycerophosphate synthase